MSYYCGIGQSYKGVNDTKTYDGNQVFGIDINHHQLVPCLKSLTDKNQVPW